MVVHIQVCFLKSYFNCYCISFLPARAAANFKYSIFIQTPDKNRGTSNTNNHVFKRTLVRDYSLFMGRGDGICFWGESEKF